MGYLDEVVWKGSYKYYDTPDGKDCHKKLFYVTKYAGLSGLLASSINVLAFSHPKGYASILGQYAYITFPLMGVGAAFAVATCASTNIRKKDDPVNYSIGAIAASAVWGAWRKSFRIAIYGGFASALFAAVFKDMIDKKYTMFNDKPLRTNMHSWSLEQNWTLLEDPGRKWKKSADEKLV